MHIALLDTPTTGGFGDWAAEQLRARGHDIHRAPAVEASDAASVGQSLATELNRNPPQVYLAAGWEAGMAAHLAARTTRAPVVVRLARASRSPGSDEDRIESAVVRSSERVLVPSAGELDRLVNRGVARAGLRVLPEPVDTRRFTDAGPAGPAPRGEKHRVGVATPSDGSTRHALLAGIGSMPACDPVAVPVLAEWDDAIPELLRSLDLLIAVDDTEAEVATTLAAMACGVAVVAADVGLLSDIVADGVSGLLVGRGGTAPAIRALLSDDLRRQGMGLAAVDRVGARFGHEVVGRSLEHELTELVPPAVDGTAEREPAALRRPA